MLGLDANGWAAVSVVAALVAGVAAIFAAFDTRWSRVDQTIGDVARSLLSTEVQDAREVVAQAARSQRLSRSERGEFRVAVFRMMWTIQAIGDVAGYVGKTGNGRPQARRLVAHVNLMMPDLRESLIRHGHRFDWKVTGQETNAVLDDFPMKVKSAWSRELIKLTTVRLDVS